MDKRKYPPDPSIETIERLINKRDELQAKVTTLEKLLRRCNEIMPACPCCKGNLRTWHKIDENQTIRIGHADGCELAKKLGSD